MKNTNNLKETYGNILTKEDLEGVIGGAQEIQTLALYDELRYNRSKLALERKERAKLAGTLAAPVQEIPTELRLA